MRSRTGSSFNRTKLIATLGPASSTPEKFNALIDAGVDLCRLNFSHGSLDDHARVLRMAREWSQRNGRPLALLGDLCGPKIRLNPVATEPFRIETGQVIEFVESSEPTRPGRLTIQLPGLLREVEVGHRLYIDDGLVRLLVTDRSGDALRCNVTAGGMIASRKGVNLPDTRLTLPALTEKDRADAAWAVKNGLDYLALSFVRRPEDVQQLRALVTQANGDLGIIVKIEKVEAIEQLEALIALSDGVMVARGDLGVEMDVWQVPLMQKAIVARCRRAGKPVIVATQMLQSMVSAPTPTRAEVSDVANAILDAADAVMLSAETATGDFPVATVEMMNHIARSTEAYAAQNRCEQELGEVPIAGRVAAAIARSAAQAALTLGAKLVAAWAATGNTLRAIANQRLPMPVVGLTADERLYHKLNLLYGVTPVRIPPRENPAEAARLLDAHLLEEGLAQRGDLVVVVTSTRPNRPDATDTTLIRRLGDP